VAVAVGSGVAVTVAAGRGVDVDAGSGVAVAAIDVAWFCARLMSGHSAKAKAKTKARAQVGTLNRGIAANVFTPGFMPATV